LEDSHGDFVAHNPRAQTNEPRNFACTTHGAFELLVKKGALAPPDQTRKTQNGHVQKGLSLVPKTLEKTSDHPLLHNKKVNLFLMLSTLFSTFSTAFSAVKCPCRALLGKGCTHSRCT